MKKNQNAKFFCESCGAEVASNSKFCKKCGRFFASVRCPVCGETGASEKFEHGCPNCGYSADKSLKNIKINNNISYSNKENSLSFIDKKSRSDGSLPRWIFPLFFVILICFIIATIFYLR